jgi:murein DD-endopeptidase MepM/ murein hydrolase activator NlpD
VTLHAYVVALALASLLAGCGSTAPSRIPTPHADVRERLSGREFIWPLAGKVSSAFGGRAGRRHEGVDILAPKGTEVRAAAEGITVYAGDGMRGYGNAVVLDHGYGVTTLYGHLRTVRVKSADVVPMGAVIGTVGRTGNATAYHLHFELRVDGEAVDPLAYLTR